MRSCCQIYVEFQQAVASYPGLPAHLSPQPWKIAWVSTLSSTATKKSCEGNEGLGMRLKKQPSKFLNSQATCKLAKSRPDTLLTHAQFPE